MKANLAEAQRAFGAAILHLLKTDPELRAFLIPRLTAADPKGAAMLNEVFGEQSY